MFRVMLTYELFGSGMERLKRETDLFVSNSGEIAPYVKRLRWADAFITRSVHPDSATLETCTRLKVIGIPGVGYQSYDIDLLNRMGIALVYCPGMNLRSVAEHAVALCYALTKRIVEDDREVHRDNYGVRNSFNHLELLGCHAGVAGFGNIGRETARLFRANGMEVYAYDPVAKREQVEEMGYHFCPTLEDLLEQSDIVSLHMPSLPSTYHLLNEEMFAHMREGAYLINCARGSVVDEEALLRALQSGRLAGAGLDVMEKEPFPADHPLLQLPNVIATPHVAGVTRQAAERTHAMVVDSTLRLLADQWGPQVAVANPEALEHPRWKNLQR